MNYSRFAMMILASTFFMCVLTYLNTYALEHIFFSETRAYMTILMGATMAFVMMAFMMPRSDLFPPRPLRHPRELRAPYDRAWPICRRPSGKSLPTPLLRASPQQHR